MTLKLKATTGGGSVSLSAPNSTTSNLDVDLTLPVDDGNSGQVLQTNGTGTLSWSTVTSSQWTTSGSNIYYNTGSIGIGVASPGTLVHVAATGAGGKGGEIKIQNSSARQTGNFAQLSFAPNSDYSGSVIGAFIRGLDTAGDQGNPCSLVFGTGGGGAPSEKARIDDSGRLLIGTTSTTTDATVLINKNRVPGGTGPHLVLGGFDATSWSNDEEIGAIDFWNNDSGTNGIAAQVRAIRSSTLGEGGLLLFHTANSGGAALTERMRITRNGYTKCTNTGDYHDAAGSYHEIRNSLSDWTHYITNTHGSAPYGIILRYPSVSPNNTSSFFQYFVDSTQPRFQVYSNGGIANFQSNNSNLCDEREKKNIESLDSTWGCLKNWDLKKFHYNEDSDSDNKRYGVIAQQVAQHCPEVITEWVKQKSEPARLDDDGNEVDPAKEEIVRMGVKEQQMYWMAIKALQEAQTRIETLETSNSALEARLTALEGGAS